MTRLLFLAFALAASSLATPALGGDLEASLQARYSTLKTAMAAHDAASIRSLLAPDFMSVDVAGHSETGPEMIAKVDTLGVDPNRVSRTTLLSVIAHADVATVEQRYDMKTTTFTGDGIAHDLHL